MKNKLTYPICSLVLLGFFAFQNRTYGQNSLFQDAKMLRNYVSTNVKEGKTIAAFNQNRADDILDILVPYSTFTREEIEEAESEGEGLELADGFVGNPYFGRKNGENIILLTGRYLRTPGPVISKSIAVQPPRNHYSPGGDPFATNFSDGMARFLAKRTKEELNMAFFNKFREDLNKSPMLKTMFPETNRQLDLLNTEVYFFDRYMVGIRESFVADLNLLPMHTRDYVMTWEKFPAQNRLILEDVLAAGQFFLEKKTSRDWIRYMASPEASIQDISRYPDTLANDALATIAGSFKAMNLIASSTENILDANNPDGKLPDKDVVKELRKDPVLMAIYLGLLWQRGEEIAFGKGFTFRNLLEKNANHSDFGGPMLNLMQSWSSSSEGIQENQRNLTELQATGEIEIVDTDPLYFTYIENSLGVLESGLKYFENSAGDPSVLNLKPVYDVVSSLRFLNNFHYCIKKKRYVFAIHHLAGFLETTMPANTFVGKHKKNFLRHSIFIATVAEASTAEEIAYAFESFSLPVGSSSLKKNSKVSLSVNAFPGFSGGKEYLLGDFVQKREATVISPTASAGIALNFGIKNNKPNSRFRSKGSFSVYMPLVDVGALWAYRLQDNTSEVLPVLKWENIISPGIFAIYGFGRDKPISFGVGLQRGPGLRKVTPINGLEMRDASGYRALAFLTVDIPFTHLFTKEF